MRFQTPQFIEIEDKVLGPFTIKQFIYLVGGFGSVFVFRQFIPGILAYIFAIPTIALGLALAFYQYNGKPFIYTLEASIKFYVSSKLYIWKKKSVKKKGETLAKKEQQHELAIPRLSESKLKDLAWSLDIQKMNESTFVDDSPSANLDLKI